MNTYNNRGLALMTAVKLSYLTEEEQVIVVETDKQINKGERGKTIYATARV